MPLKIEIHAVVGSSCILVWTNERSNLGHYNFLNAAGF
jgi:hypothetical protein